MVRPRTRQPVHDRGDGLEVRQLAQFPLKLRQLPGRNESLGALVELDAVLPPRERRRKAADGHFDGAAMSRAVGERDFDLRRELAFALVDGNAAYFAEE